MWQAKKNVEQLQLFGNCLFLLRMATSEGMLCWSASVVCWLSGLCFVVLSFHNHVSPVAYLTLWRDRFLSVGIRPWTYSFEYFSAQFTVYTRCHPTSHHVYIGHTAAGLETREQTRYRKYKQLAFDKLVQVEPAIRWWLYHCNFFEFVAIALLPCDGQQQANYRELSLIELWHSDLNAPHIYRLYHARTWKCTVVANELLRGRNYGEEVMATRSQAHHT